MNTVRTRVRTRRISRILVAVAGVSIFLGERCLADDNWQSDAGDWFAPENWSQGVPQSNVNAYIGNGGTARIVSGYASPMGLSLGASAGQSGTIEMTGGRFGVQGGTTVGYKGTGTFIQTGGLSAPGYLRIGEGAGGTGLYALSDGTLTVAGKEYIGIAGTGTFTQIGGTHVAPWSLSNPTPILYMGDTGGSGTYLLSGGALDYSRGTVYVGYRGAGTFTQTGGDNNVASLTIANSSSATGAYNLQGGNLTAGSITLANAGATFTQTGGTLACGTFTQTNGSASLQPISLSGGRRYTLSAGSFACPTIEVNAGGTFSMTGGTLACSAFNLRGGSATFPTIILDSGAVVPVVSTPPGVEAPIFNLASGTIGATNQYLGYNGGTSVFTQTADNTFSPTNLYVAHSADATATYALSGGTLTSQTAEYVGYRGTGTFTQTGGANNTASLVLSYSAGSAGTYDLQGGSLTATTISLGKGSAFTHAGGTLTFTTFDQNGGGASFGPLVLGNGGSGTRYNLTSGNLTTPSITMNPGGTFSVGSGTLACSAINLSGGTASFSSIVLDTGQIVPAVATPAGVESPVFTFSSGTISAYTQYLGYVGGVSSFTQTAGVSLNPSSMYVGYNSGATATYTLASGSLKAHTEYVGYRGVGTFTQTGGSNEVTNLNIGNYGASSGTYDLQGGTLAASNITLVTGGAFTQTGGSLTCSWFNQNNGSASFSALTLAGNTRYALAGGTLASPVITLNAGTSLSISGGTLSFTTMNVNTGSAFSQTGGSLQGQTLNQNGGSVQWGSVVMSGADVTNLRSLITGVAYNYSSGSFTVNTEYVGYSADGAYTQTKGTNTPSNITVGMNAGVSGTYTLTGTGSLKATVGYVGRSGIGQFIQDNGTNTIQDLYVGYAAGSTGKYVLSGGQLQNSTSRYDQGGVYVGHSGVGQFIQSGGYHSPYDLYVGSGAGGKGTYTLTGGTLRPVVDEVIGHLNYIGTPGGEGIFNQSGGANSCYEVFIGLGGRGTFNLSGGTLSAGSINVGEDDGAAKGVGEFVQTGGSNQTQNLYIGNVPISNPGSGAFTLSGGTLAVTRSVIVGGRTGHGALIVQGGLMTADTVSSADLICLALPGSGGESGLLNVTTAYVQTPPAELRIILGERAAAISAAPLNVAGTTTLDGTLTIALADGFVPQPGEVFEIIRTGALVGAFSEVHLPADQNLYQLKYTSAGVTLSVVPEPSGLGLLCITVPALLARQRARRAAKFGSMR